MSQAQAEAKPNREAHAEDKPQAQAALAETRADLERGVRFAHVMLSVNQDQANEAVAYVQAVAEALVQKGLITAEELEEPLERARQDILKLQMPRVRLAEMGDKYAPGQSIDIDCASLIPLCKARCCAFKFFLTKQDLEEGAAKWDYGNPYWIRQTPDGFCTHSNPQTRACTIHAKRPHVCRKYDCRNDTRVWLDFARRIPAPMPEMSGNAPVALAEVALHNSIREAGPKMGNEIPGAGDGDEAARSQVVKNG